MDFPSPEELLAQCEQIFTSASQKISGESQLELKAEVAESVKYELAQLSWLDRLAVGGPPVTLATTHPDCRIITGTIEQTSPSILVLATDSFRFLINPKHITWLQTTTERVSLANQQPLDQFALRLWLQQLCDSKAERHWFLTDGSAVVGRPVRLFADAVEVATNSHSIIVVLNHICVIRLAL